MGWLWFLPKKKDPPQAGPYQKLEEKLEYKFRDPALLTLALSHRSYVHSQNLDQVEDSNERLEFLGDAVLDLVITEYLYHKHPQKKEGELSKYKSLVVSAKVLMRCAINCNLGDFILLSKSEKKSGGRKRTSILADAYEAVLGAVYLDGGIEPATRIIHSTLISIMDEVLGDEELANYKSRLLELTQGQGMGTPEYNIISEEGPEHKKEFTVGVFIQGEKKGEGSGMSKKSAEQAAARFALENADIQEN